MSDERASKRLVCPNCGAKNTKDDWNASTQRYLPGHLDIKEAVERRDIHGHTEFVCPACLHGVPLAEVVHEH